MKARLLCGLSGLDYYLDVGEIVEGAEAVALCAKGLAVPLKEERETAQRVVVAMETAVSQLKRRKETQPPSD